MSPVQGRSISRFSRAAIVIVLVGVVAPAIVAQTPVMPDRAARPVVSLPAPPNTGIATLDGRPTPAPSFATARDTGACMTEISWGAVERAGAYVVTNVVEGTYWRRQFAFNPLASPRQERHERSIRVPATQLSKTLDHDSYGGVQVTHRYSVSAVGSNGTTSPVIAAPQVIDGCNPIRILGHYTSPPFPW